jgi:serine/threonine-protein phosphatase 2A activator
LEGFAKDYLYLQCIQWIVNAKVGPFSVHSPLLNDISGVRTWTKVNQGLFKMYQVEVLGKLPIMQHTHFGTLFPWRAASLPSCEHEEMKNSIASTTTTTHSHDAQSQSQSHLHQQGDTLPSCCVSRLPSVFACGSNQQEKCWRIPQD